MKLISTDTAFKTNLIRLITKYPNISFGTAWALSGTEVFTALVQVKAKIRSAVIGTHFYQTHPDVLDEFVDSAIVKFVLHQRARHVQDMAPNLGASLGEVIPFSK